MNTLEPTILKTCGDCAARLIEVGCAPAMGEITYGSTCEVHPSDVPRAATNLIAPMGFKWREVLAEKPAKPLTRNPAQDTSVEQFASVLLAAWVKEPCSSDRNTVRFAIEWARTLISETEKDP